jgi:hypothetical protein
MRRCSSCCAPLRRSQKGSATLSERLPTQGLVGGVLFEGARPHLESGHQLVNIAPAGQQDALLLHGADGALGDGVPRWVSDRSEITCNAPGRGALFGVAAGALGPWSVRSCTPSGTAWGKPNAGSNARSMLARMAPGACDLVAVTSTTLRQPRSTAMATATVPSNSLLTLAKSPAIRRFGSAVTTCLVGAASSRPSRSREAISADILAIEKEAEGLLDGLLKGGPR